MIRFQCSNCGKKLKASEDLVGRRVKCTQCDVIELVPDASIASAAVNEIGSQSVTSKPAVSDPLPSNPQVEDSAQVIVKNAEPAEEPAGHMFGRSASTPASGRSTSREFKPKSAPSRTRRWAIVAAVLLGLTVASAVTYVIVKRAYGIPKFKAEFEAMVEVEFYRRAHGQLERTRRRMLVMANAFKAKGSPTGDFSQQHQRLNASVDSYTNNSESVLTEAAMLLANGKDLHAKSLLVATGKEMQALVKDIEREVGQFNKKARR